MIENLKHTSDIEQVFRTEFDFASEAAAILQKKSLGGKDLTDDYKQLLKAYKQLLQQAVKITKVGDSAQRKLIKTQEKLETLNNDLLELYQTVDTERERANDLLLNILPAPIAERMKHGESLIADRLDDVSILFADIVGFTTLSSKISASQLVDLLNNLFSLFDELADRNGLEKIKTIGDMYMAAGGLHSSAKNPVEAAAQMALEMQASVHYFNQKILSGVKGLSVGQLAVRVGMHTGEVVAGVIGKRKFIYDLWGDTVNIASRMESHGLPNTVQVTQTVYDKLNKKFTLKSRGEIDIKGKGLMTTYFLIGKKEK